MVFHPFHLLFGGFCLYLYFVLIVISDNTLGCFLKFLHLGYVCYIITQPFIWVQATYTELAVAQQTLTQNISHVLQASSNLTKHSKISNNLNQSDLPYKRIGFGSWSTDIYFGQGLSNVPTAVYVSSVPTGTPV